jgi:hypothetical protein
VRVKQRATRWASFSESPCRRRVFGTVCQSSTQGYRPRPRLRMAGTIRGRGNDGEILYEGLEGFLYYCKNTWTAVCLTTLLETPSWQRMTFAHEQRLLMMWLTNTLAILTLGTHLIRLPFDFHSMVQASSSAFAKSHCHRSCNRSRRDVSYRPLPKHPLTALNCLPLARGLPQTTAL